jgi:hypothetical protein
MNDKEWKTLKTLEAEKLKTTNRKTKLKRENYL